MGSGGSSVPLASAAAVDYLSRMVRAAVLLAEGFEELEAVTIIDVLRRGEVEVVSLGVTGTTVRGSHGISLLAERALASGAQEAWDLCVTCGSPTSGTSTGAEADIHGACFRSVC